MTLVRAAALASTLSLLFTATTTAGAAGVTRAGAVDPTDPDDLYRHREDMADAERAAEIWAAHVLSDYASAWKLARAYYWIGTKGPAAGRRAALSQGIDAGRDAVKLSPNGPEGHFWLAAD